MNEKKMIEQSAAMELGLEDVARARAQLSSILIAKMLNPIAEELERGDRDRFALGELLSTLTNPRNRETFGVFPGSGQLYQIVDRMSREYEERYPAARDLQRPA